MKRKSLGHGGRFTELVNWLTAIMLNLNTLGGYLVGAVFTVAQADDTGGRAWECASPGICQLL